jgi:hypothetical protein
VVAQNSPARLSPSQFGTGAGGQQLGHELNVGAPVQWSGAPYCGQYATLWGDVNGDGKADLIAVSTFECVGGAADRCGFLSAHPVAVRSP